MAQYVVFTIGRDRPGIVAAVTAVIFEVGGNLLDTSMTLLSGHCAVALAVDAPVGIAALEAALVQLETQFDVDITVRPIATPEYVQATERLDHDPEFVVSVYGADQPGIVARVTALLASRGVNVVDLNTRHFGDPADPVYAMLLEVAVAPEAVSELRSALEAVAAEMGIEASLHLADSELL